VLKLSNSNPAGFRRDAQHGHNLEVQPIYIRVRSGFDTIPAQLKLRPTRKSRCHSDIVNNISPFGQITSTISPSGQVGDIRVGQFSLRLEF
jgi:hypothetical protein